MTSSQVGRFSFEQLETFAATYGTPLYVYDGDRIVSKFRRLRDAFAKHLDGIKVFYALKANTNMSIVGLLKSAGAMAECISMGELMLARKLGYQGEELLFTSNSKSPQELVYALEAGALINLDSLGDLENLIQLVERVQKKVSISFRLNTDVDPVTHKHIATSHKTTKFGIMIDEIETAYRRAQECSFLTIKGMHSHIGSQIMDAKFFFKNIDIMLNAALRIKKQLGIELTFLNMGGGLGVAYEDDLAPLVIEEVAEQVCGRFKEACVELGYEPNLWLEPGRYFVGDAGILLSRVNSVKKTKKKNFINVDTGFNHLLRPVLYEAHHRVRVLNKDGVKDSFDVAGNICETGDILAEDRVLNTPEVGDTLAFLDAGAYGFSMASGFNMFPLPTEILVRGDKEELIRKRETMDDMLRNQVLLKDLQ